MNGPSFAVGQSVIVSPPMTPLARHPGALWSPRGGKHGEPHEPERLTLPLFNPYPHLEARALA